MKFSTCNHQKMAMTCIALSFLIQPSTQSAMVKSDTNTQQLIGGHSHYEQKVSSRDSNSTEVNSVTIEPEADAQIVTDLTLNYNRHLRALQSSSRQKRKDKQGLMSRILPLMVIPFLISSTLIPMMLVSLKFMLLKSLLVGKVAILLLALNALWKSENRGGVYSHNVNIQPDQKDLHMNHYGFNGDVEYGAYINRRMERRNKIR